LLTDGAVTNTAEVLHLPLGYRSRIYTLGIGNAASVDLVRGLAEFTSGTDQFVDDPVRIEEAVFRSLADAPNSLLVNVEIQSNCGILFQTAPRSIGRQSLTTIKYFSNVSCPTCEMKLNGRTVGKENFSKSYGLDQAHQMFSTILHSHVVLSASNRDIISKAESLALAKRLNPCLVAKF
jgi:hypothetical protein